MSLHESWQLGGNPDALYEHYLVPAMFGPWAADLVALVFKKSEMRLARALLLLAGADERRSSRYPMPKISRNLLAEMTGLTRSKVDSLMNDFRKHGFLERNSERNGGLQVHQSLLNVVLQN